MARKTRVNTDLQKEYRFWKSKQYQYNYRNRNNPNKKKIKISKTPQNIGRREVEQAKKKYEKAIGKSTKSQYISSSAKTPKKVEQKAGFTMGELLRRKLVSFANSLITDDYTQIKAQAVIDLYDNCYKQATKKDEWTSQMNSQLGELEREIEEFFASTQAFKQTKSQSTQAWQKIITILSQDDTIISYDNIYFSEKDGTIYYE